MSRIPFTVRIQGRYAFRRRVHFRNVISKPLTLALQTADPSAARMRAAILAARFVIVRADIRTMLENQRTLTGVEIEAIFRRELEQQLGSWLSDAYANAPWSSSVIEEAARHGDCLRLEPAIIALIEGFLRRRPDHSLSSELRDYADRLRQQIADGFEFAA